MRKVILLQAGVVAIAAILCGLVAGINGGISALTGGLAYLVPNMLFMLRLGLQGGRSSVVLFVVGELLKVAGTIGILVVAIQLLQVHWVCLLIGLVAALKANLFAFLLKN